MENEEFLHRHKVIICLRISSFAYRKNCFLEFRQFSKVLMISQCLLDFYPTLSVYGYFYVQVLLNRGSFCFVQFWPFLPID